MAADIFAKIGDIKGESTDDKHKDEIEVLSFSWGVTNAATSDAGGGGGVGKATFQDLSIVHKIDKASPKLLQACATGTHLKEATITHRKAGKGQQEFLIIKMNDVIITGVAQSAHRQRGGIGDRELWRLPRSTWSTSRKRPTGRSTREFISSSTSRPTKSARAAFDRAQGLSWTAHGAVRIIDA